MAWELASFPADLLGDVPELDGVRRRRRPRRASPVRDHARARRRRAADRGPDGRAAFPTEGRAGRGPHEPPRRRRRPLLPRLPGRGAAAARAGVDRRPGRPRRGADAVRRGHERRPHLRGARRISATRSSRPGRGARRSPSPRSSRRPTLDAEPVEVERFELGPADESLPAVAALVQLSDLGPLYYQYLYGVPVGQAGLPRAVDPAELLDGAVTCGEYHWAAPAEPDDRLPAQRARARACTGSTAGGSASPGSCSCAATSRPRTTSSAPPSRRGRGGRRARRRRRRSSRRTRAATRTRTPCSPCARARRPASGRPRSSPRWPTPRPRPPG